MWLCRCWLRHDWPWRIAKRSENTRGVRNLEGNSDKNAPHYFLRRPLYAGPITNLRETSFPEVFTDQRQNAKKKERAPKAAIKGIHSFTTEIFRNNGTSAGEEVSGERRLYT